MCRQSKNRKQAARSKQARGEKARQHFAEGQAHMKCPHQQVAPCWLVPNTKKRSWWNKKAPSVTRRDLGLSD